MRIPAPRQCVAAHAKVMQRRAMTRKREQISVPVDSELRDFLERVAAREDRTLAGQVRHLLLVAARAERQRQHRVVERGIAGERVCARADAFRAAFDRLQTVPEPYRKGRKWPDTFSTLLSRVGCAQL
jgi:hypothetical protein